MLFADDGEHRAATAADATDGLSRTLLVAEAIDRGDATAPDRDPDATGRWARINCFAQSAAFVNALGSDISSHHTGGAQAACGDGRVMFLGTLHPQRRRSRHLATGWLTSRSTCPATSGRVVRSLA
jgi:hypothetical protein